MSVMQDHRHILETFITRYGVTENELSDQWLNIVRETHYKKSDFILHAGDMCTEFNVIKQGIVRYFYQSPEGKEWNKSFYCEGEYVIAGSAYLTASPSPFSIQALEDTTLLTFSMQDLESLRTSDPGVEVLLTRLITEGFIRNEQREAVLLTCNAEQKYRWLYDNEKHLIDRVAQFHLASYLGMDAVSFSRIKNKF